MANVNLKTDFKDGEFLYADQLKNNFEAIQAALAAMNAIVWQDNADKVVTFRGTTEELMNREIIDGQILYDTTTGESYIDYEGKRISTGSGNAIHIGDTEPTNPSTQIWINDNELSTVGSEVVNSLEGNEERMAPSVAAVNKINTYSTEETFTGKYWIDGRPIYSKVMKFNPSGATFGFNIGLSPHEVDFVWLAEPSVCFESVNGNIYPITGSTYNPDGDYIFVRFAKETSNWFLDLRADSHNRINEALITLEYTKTTDIVEESEE